MVIGIAASGTTPYVIGALEQCNKHKIKTGCITCNPNSPVAKTAKYPIVSGGRPRICYRQHTHESRYCPEACFEYDIYFGYDKHGAR